MDEGKWRDPSGSAMLVTSRLLCHARAKEDRPSRSSAVEAFPTLKPLPLYTGPVQPKPSKRSCPISTIAIHDKHGLTGPRSYPGENVVWRGKPLRSKYATKDSKQTLAGIPVAIFSDVLDVDGPEDSEESWCRLRGFLPAFGMLFVAQALHFLLGHYLRNWLGGGKI